MNKRRTIECHKESQRWKERSILKRRGHSIKGKVQFPFRKLDLCKGHYYCSPF